MDTEDGQTWIKTLNTQPTVIHVQFGYVRTATYGDCEWAESTSSIGRSVCRSRRRSRHSLKFQYWLHECRSEKGECGGGRDRQLNHLSAVLSTRGSIGLFTSLWTRENGNATLLFHSFAGKLKIGFRIKVGQIN